MAKERRDNKNRILSKGEYQREDGRYMYRYTDAVGKVQYVYSWTLTKTDRVPKGKPSGQCLRDLEKKIAEDLASGINATLSKRMTVNDYFDLYMSQKKNLKETTRVDYAYKYDLHVRNTFGLRKIADVRYTDVKAFYNDLAANGGSNVTVMDGIHKLLNPVFKMAVRDGCIKINPVIGVAAEIRAECKYTPEPRRALTEEQQDQILDYISDHVIFKKWKPILSFLLGSGCRIGEACALTWSDCDFKNGLISINKSLAYCPPRKGEKSVAKIVVPKSRAGIRTIPMLPSVKELLLDEKKDQLINGFNFSLVDGVSGFVFHNTKRGLLLPKSVACGIDNIVNSYNKLESNKAMEDGREPELLPKLSPHIFRHTFCTRLCENEVNVKVVQEVMGHANVSLTMNVYCDVTKKFKQDEILAVADKIRVG